MTNQRCKHFEPSGCGITHAGYAVMDAYKNRCCWCEIERLHAENDCLHCEVARLQRLLQQDEPEKQP
jgi:hypothetical protein